MVSKDAGELKILNRWGKPKFIRKHKKIRV